MKKRGFTLIELVVVIALIAILAVTLAPRLRDQIAKANDSKAIAVLGSLRTGSEVYFAENSKPMRGSTGDFTTDAAAVVELRDKFMDESARKLFDSNSYVPVGGSKTTSGSGGTVIYGGDIGFGFTNPDTSASSDGIALWFDISVVSGSGVTVEQYDTKGKDWELAY